MIEIKSLPTTIYGEIIEISTPIRFYWNKDKEFDGVEIGEFQTVLTPWEEDMLEKCLDTFSRGSDSETTYRNLYRE